MKSKTYQKEGWSALEEEIRFFGENAEKQKNLESEDNFDFNHTDKELLDKKIDDAVKDLTDWLESEPQDEIYLSDEEINVAIEKILQRTHPDQAHPVSEKTHRSKKVTLRVLFVAAILMILSVSCLFAVGNSRDISIENGFVTFAKDTVKIIFFGDNKEKFITVDMLIDDLRQNGYENILLPQDFVDSAVNYKVSVPEYVKEKLCKQVVFEINSEENTYVFNMCKVDLSGAPFSYEKLNNAVTVVSNGVYIYVFEFDGTSIIEFIHDDCFYSIKADIPLSDMVKIAESIK